MKTASNALGSVTNSTPWLNPAAPRVHELTKKNLLTSDPNKPAFSVATGEARSRGVELDISGRQFFIRRKS